ncbi:MAG: hypothetical protein ACLTDO_08755 [Bifidobacterium pseudocatenulatum]
MGSEHAEQYVADCMQDFPAAVADGVRVPLRCRYVELPTEVFDNKTSTWNTI